MDSEKNLYTEDILPELLDLSKKHDISHLLAYGLDKNAMLTEDSKYIGNEVVIAIYRYMQLNYDYLKLSESFEAAKIPYLPLKGSVIRKYYPEAWMRTSCDIDILIHNEDMSKATDLLINNCGYTYHGKGSHDVSLFSPNNIHIELHYELVEDGLVKEASKILNSVWNNTVKKSKYCFEMTDEFFYFYHIAHMAKHFENGGCGIRPFIDLWILDNIEGAEEKRRNELLMKGNLLKFADAARNLSKVWLDNAEHTEITKQMEQYILKGGVYGNMENQIIVQQQKKGGRLKYAFFKVFIPYDVIKFHYPILQKHRWLLPIMEVRRWFKLVFCGHAKRTIKELKYNNNISNTEAENMQKFLENIGL